MGETFAYILIGIVIVLLLFVIICMLQSRSSRPRHWPDRPIIPYGYGPYWQHGGGPNRPGKLY